MAKSDERETPTSNLKFTPTITSGIRMGVPKSKSVDNLNKRKYFGGTEDWAGSERESLDGEKKRCFISGS